MTRQTKTATKTQGGVSRASIRRAFATAAIGCATLAIGLALPTTAAASKQVIDFFGNSPGTVTTTLGGQFKEAAAGVAVNNSGAGPANQGDIYVADLGNNRIERFGRDDNGTPADTADDTYFFISAWGAGVNLGGTNYEVCTVAASCRAATASGGNGTQAGNGALDEAQSVAVDQDSGDVYVSDAGNSRVNVYEGDGTFLRSFGYDVVQSGPDQVAGPDEQQQLTVKASGGKLSLSFAGETSGGLGSGDASKGSKTIVHVETTSGAFAIGQIVSGTGIPPGTTITAVNPAAETLSLSQALTGEHNGAQQDRELFADNLPYNASAAEVQASLNGLSTIGGIGGSVTVTGGPGDESGSAPYTIAFGGTLAERGVLALRTGAKGLSIAAGTASAAISTLTEGGAHEVCKAGVDICRAGAPGTATGEFGEPRKNEFPGFHIAVSQPDGNPASGTVFVADSPNSRVDTYNLDGSSPGSFGSAAVFDEAEPHAIAVDSRGIVYTSNRKNHSEIERYDSENANGGGVGFLAPIPSGINEVQELTVGAGAGQFRLSFEGKTTKDIAFNASAETVQGELEALSTIGPEAVYVPGGRGNPAGSNPYTIKFENALGARDVEQIAVLPGTTPLSGGAGASVATTTPGQSGLLPQIGRLGLVVDPDEDGAGPESDVLYVLNYRSIQQLGPLNPPGLTSPPTAADDIHGTKPGVVINGTSALALEPSTGRLYVTGQAAGSFSGTGVYVLGTAGPPPTATLDSLSNVTTHSVTAHATIDPNGPPDTSYHLEYSTDGVKWTSTPSAVVGHQEAPQAVEATIEPPPIGLQPGTLYHVRLVAGRKLGTPITTPELTFTTLAAKPIVETTGTPIRTTTTAQLQGRVDPGGSATTYHFEYGEAGPCDSNPCTATPDVAAGSDNQFELAAAEVEGLEPNTTYHYRILADNAAPGAASPGNDMTVTTRASDASLSHGHFPGPPGSDRAYELVSLPDTSGNPVGLVSGFAGDGNGAVYGVFGGTPISDAGSAFSLYYAKRDETAPHVGSWQSQSISAPRDQLVGPSWLGLLGANDLSGIDSLNTDLNGKKAIWHLAPGGKPSKLFEPIAPQVIDESGAEGPLVAVSTDDGARTIARIKGGALDPAFPEAAAKPNLYDVSSGSPQLVSLLPGNLVTPCGASGVSQLSHSVSTDGSLLLFESSVGNCSANFQLYLRDIPAGETKLISGPPLSGPDCGGSLIKQVPGFAFFSTSSRLVGEDEAPGSNCGTGMDIYRYDIANATYECVTCQTNATGAKLTEIAVSDDGSRIFFTTQTPLLPGAPSSGSPGAYRLDIATGDLASVGGGGGQTGLDSGPGTWYSSDGRFFSFLSSDKVLNPLGEGTDNGGTPQVYLYDDANRSLECVSCPSDGSPPPYPYGEFSYGDALHPNLTPLADNGTIAFSTPNPLAPADQNTPLKGGDSKSGVDVYEWRDGRQMLVTDGLTSWEGLPPGTDAVSPSGRDVFFTVAARYTPDAIDGFYRLYDARIGGGFEFSPPPPPCPLEVCQGTPKGAPEEQEPGTANFTGAGNVAEAPARCRKGKVRRRGRCVARHPKPRQHKRANRNRRTGR